MNALTTSKVNEKEIIFFDQTIRVTRPGRWLIQIVWLVGFGGIIFRVNTYEELWGMFVILIATILWYVRQFTKKYTDHIFISNKELRYTSDKKSVIIPIEHAKYSYGGQHENSYVCDSRNTFNRFYVGNTPCHSLFPKVINAYQTDMFGELKREIDYEEIKHQENILITMRERFGNTEYGILCLSLVGIGQLVYGLYFDPHISNDVFHAPQKLAQEDIVFMWMGIVGCICAICFVLIHGIYRYWTVRTSTVTSVFFGIVERYFLEDMVDLKLKNNTVCISLKKRENPLEIEHLENPEAFFRALQQEVVRIQRKNGMQEGI